MFAIHKYTTRDKFPITVGVYSKNNTTNVMANCDLWLYMVPYVYLFKYNAALRIQERFEDTKVVIRSRKSKKDR
jgi:hypothetical protein